MSYPGMTAHGWIGNLGWVTELTNCELESQEDFHLRRESDSKMIGCGLCEVDWTAL